MLSATERCSEALEIRTLSERSVARTEEAGHLDSRQRLPRTKAVDRAEFLCSLATGKRVIHVGFWGTEGIREPQEGAGTWLHARLASVAKELIGVDISEGAVRRAREQGYEAYSVDCCDLRSVEEAGIAPCEVVIAGEVIEHVDAPGALLDAMHAFVGPTGVLVLTTPNAYSLFNSLMTLMKREVINPDHVAIYSWYTLTNVVGRHGWDVEWIGTYHYPGPRTLRGRIVFGLQHVISAWRPFLAHGLIAVCRAR